MLSMFHNLFIFLIIFQIFLYSVFITPFIFIYIIYHFLYFIFFKNIINNLYLILKWYSNIKIIKNLLSLRSQLNPFYDLYIYDKTNFIRNNLTNNLVKIKYREIETNRINNYTGKLIHMVPGLFCKIDDKFYRKEFMIDINISDMYLDLINYRNFKVGKNLPNELNILIESYLYSFSDEEREIKNKYIHFKKANNFESMFGIQIENSDSKITYTNIINSFQKYESFIPVILNKKLNATKLILKDEPSNYSNSLDLVEYNQSLQHKFSNVNKGSLNKLLFLDDYHNIYYFMDAHEL